MQHAPRNWNELKSQVHNQLCIKENLIPEQFPLEVHPVVRGADLCAVEFALFGPRQIRLTAIWTLEANTVLFYDARGIRFHNWRLSRRLSDLPEELYCC